ncbi:MAG TPA: ABC transporter ATP-binding protein [Longimicrobiales bacterium]|nr:ABC transporter ATP-binding protein [Longimicrobiales bacterium]
MSQLRSVLPYVRPYRAGIAAGIGFILLANAFGILVPDLIRQGIDALGQPATSRTTLFRFAALIVGATLLSGAARFAMRQLLNAISRRIESDLRDAFFAHLIRLDAGFFAATRTGDLMSRATNDLQAVRQAVGPGVMYLVNTLVSTLAAIFFMLRYSAQLTMIALIPITLLPVVMKYFGRVIHQKAERIQEHLGVLSSMVQENLSGVRIVRAYRQEQAQEAEFAALNREYLDRNMSLARTSAVFQPSLSILTGLGLLAVLWFGGQQAIAGEITIGEFVAFNFYLAMLTWPMIALGWVINLFQRGAASMGRINRIMAAAPAIAEPAVPRSITPVRGDIEFRDVWFRYPGTERWVLRAVSLRVRAGESAALVGRTGAGKSTIIALLTRRYDATKGTITIDGVPIDQIPLAELRSAIGVVPQDAFVFSDTLENNLGLALDGAADRHARIVWASEIAQLHDTIAAFPHGFATRVGERGVTLSGGQRQRATLARAVAGRPAILVLDDALSAVDTHTEKEILARLRDVTRSRTSIVVSHRVSAVLGADQILVLEDGRISESGQHAALIARGGTYATLLRRQLLEEGLEVEPLAAEGGAV